MKRMCTSVTHVHLFFLLLACLFSGLVQADSVVVRQLTSADTLCPRCAIGDYLIVTAKLETIVGGSHRKGESFYKFPTADAFGSVISIRPLGTTINGDILLGTPYLRISNTTHHIGYDKITFSEDGDKLILIAQGSYSDKQQTELNFVGKYVFEANAEKLALSLTVSNAGSHTKSNLIHALFFDPYQMYYFSPGEFEEHQDLEFYAYPRDNHLFVWADPTPRKSRYSDFDFGWDGGMILSDPTAINLTPGSSDTRHYQLFSGQKTKVVLENLYKQIAIPSRPVSLYFDRTGNKTFEVIVRSESSSAIFFRSFLDSSESLAIELPLGKYTAQANFFPGIGQCTFTVTDQSSEPCTLVDPPHGAVDITLVNSAGEPVAGKVSFNGIAPTLTPYLGSVNPTKDDGYWESHRNSVFPVDKNKTVTLPVGSYWASATGGPHYSLDQRKVHISKGQTEELLLQIDKVIDRPDLISLDTHLHTLESDGSVNVAEKIKALVASGLDVAISSDHNFPVDYQKELEKLGLQNQLRVYTGTEVSVPERLDYNSYPMAVHPDEHNHGAIDALSGDVSSRFELSRARDKDVLIQVNHPRYWQFDYFSWFELDPVSAAFANEGFDLSFDVLEVVNGATFDREDNQSVLRDWLNLLNRGYFFPLVGTSDSHEIDQDEPGFSRTYLYRGDAENTVLSIQQLMQRLKEGRSFASNGPFLDLTVQDQYRPGDSVSIMGGAATIRIDVLTAPWIEATQVQLYINGRPQTVPMTMLPHPSASHHQATVTLDLEKDSYVVAEVTGSKDLFPMLQRRSSTDGTETGVLPYALTNPIFIDVDGNGKFDPPLPHHIEIREK